MRSDWSTSSVVSELSISSLNDLREKNCSSTSFNKFDTGSGTFSVICTKKADKTPDSKPSVDSTESVDKPADSGGKDKTGKDKGSDSSGGDTVNGIPRDKGKLGGDGSGDSDKTDKDKNDDGKDDKTLLDGILDGIKKLGDKVSDGLNTLGGKHDETNQKLDDNGKKQDETNAKIGESNTLLGKVLDGLNALTDAVKSGFEKLTGKKDGTAAGDNELANGGGGSTVNVPGQNGNGQNGGGKDGVGESGNGSGSGGELQGIGEGFFDGVTIPERQAGQGQGGWQPESLGGGGVGSCPAPKVFHIATYSVELSYELLCRFLEMVRWAVLLGFTLFSAFIVFGSLRD
ncbi:hypothetical protein NQ012_12730 [Neisseria dentiae]|nr:hypothetical protein [Neisseria dentiae]